QIVADAGRGVAAEIDDLGGECQLICPAGDVPVGPRDSGAAAKVGGIRGAEADGMLGALTDAQRDRNLTGTVGLGVGLYRDRGENTEGEQILAGGFNLAGAILLALM